MIVMELLKKDCVILPEKNVEIARKSGTRFGVESYHAGYSDAGYGRLLRIHYVDAPG
jgi:hypothetical protein